MYEPMKSLDEILTCHQEVAETVWGRLIQHGNTPRSQLHRWGAIHVVFSRSSNFGCATKLLLDSEYWEAAGVLTRTVFEDAGVLAYIRSRGSDAEDFARLFLISDAQDRLRAWKGFKKHKIVSRYDTPKARRCLREKVKEFREFRDGLWQGEHDENGQPLFQDADSWNGLSIASTFRQAGRRMQFDCCYARLCELVHPSVYGVTYAFPDELRLDGHTERIDQQKLSLWILRQLMIALGIQIEAAQALIGVTPKGGMPDLEALMQEAGSAD